MDTNFTTPTRTVTIGPAQPFVIIGERINPTGRKVLAEQMQAMNMDLVRRDAVRQVEAGAHMLDVNAGVPGEGLELAAMKAAIQAVQAVVDVPLALDSASEAALDAGLSVYQGKALVNSVTGEDARLEAVLPLVKKYGAAVIGIPFDEQGISKDPQVRLAVAQKILARAERLGIPPEDVLIDPLVMTVSADEQAAVSALETVRLVKDKLGVNMVCGASNVSFGLPWRKVINTAFLSMLIAVGLPAAITNPLDAELRQTVLAADLLLARDPFAANFIGAYRAAQKQESASV